MNASNKNNWRNRGFTLVELIVVVTILSLVTGLLAVKIYGPAQKAKREIARMQIGKVKAGVDRAALDTGSYPANEEGLMVLTQVSLPGENWNGPYLDNADLNDPWKRSLQYRRPCRHGGLHEYDLFSLGPNGRDEGGDGGDDIDGRP